MPRVVEYRGDTGCHFQRSLVFDRTEVRQCALGLLQVVERRLENEVRLGRISRHRRVVVRLPERRQAHARAHALLVAKGQFVHARSDHAAAGQRVAGLEAALVFLLGELLLALDFLFLSLIFAGRLVGMLQRPVALSLRELLLELAGVEQNQAGQLDSAFRGIDGAPVTLGHDVWNEPAMIQMGVGENDRVQLGRVVGEGHAIAHHLVRPALEHAAVDEHLGSIGDEEELGAGDGVGSTKEVDFHTRILPPLGAGRCA